MLLSYLFLREFSKVVFFLFPGNLTAKKAVIINWMMNYSKLNNHWNCIPFLPRAWWFCLINESDILGCMKLGFCEMHWTPLVVVKDQYSHISWCIPNWTRHRLHQIISMFYINSSPCNFMRAIILSNYTMWAAWSRCECDF